ncbi:dnaJ homolog subfamily C member 16 isoform X2 [Palaemon carinicauda]|uniref:dnaJ homolog subfamily C member 16 isoform X2 n=1 Tax=Palaemon carinicauda TaxID=392227 RepID=UPI0035B68D80
MRCTACFLLLSTLLVCVLARIKDPYSILELKKKADTQDIKKAYKKLAKEWHPDKNKSPQAEAKFIEINQAYELLMDPERRRLYDSTGQTDEQPNFRRQHDYSSFRRFDPFDDIFSNLGGSFRFNFKHGDGSNIYQKQSITFKAYQNSVVQLSKKQPYLLLFYSDWCIACAHIEPIWRRLYEELEPINFGMATVHAGHEVELARKLGVNTVPYLVMVLDGHPYHYTEASVSMVSSLDFIRTKFPHKLVLRVTEESLETFLGGWMDNKVRVLIFGRLDIIRLRYLTVGWEFRERAVIGYVQMDRADTDSIRTRYSVSNKVDTLLVFHEDLHTPVASVAMTDLPYATMKDIIEGNKFLVLPRLSSQNVFDALCPVESVRSRRRLCVVLVTQDDPTHDPSRAALREYASLDQARERDRVRYAYLFREKQVEFMNALTAASGSPLETNHHIVILWRKDQNHLKYEWLDGGWEVEPEKHNASREALRAAVQRLLHSNQPMPFETVVQELFDEHAQGIVWRIINKLVSVQDYFRENVTQDDLVPAVSIFITVLFIVAGGYVMSYLVKLEEERVSQSGGVFVDPTGKLRVQPQLKVHELRGETYNGLVRMLKPGCRTLVMLCDSESRSKLMPKFHKACWPYRKNKTLMFSFLNIERASAMEWYKRILILGLPEPRDLNINPKNTIGTVIALNGHRKYYCLYHAKHPESVFGAGSPATSEAEGGGLRRRAPRSGISGDFMGFSDNETESDSDIESGDKRKDSAASDKPLLNYYSNILFEEQLLEGLTMWMDRLFEGSTFRYHINYWPDWPGK